MLTLATFASLLSFSVVVVLAQSVPEWGQCGGIGWTGGTTCASGLTCVRLNDWYYQCLRASTTQAPPASTTAAPTSAAPTSAPPASSQPPPASSVSFPPASGTGLTARFASKGRLHWGTCSDSSLLSNTQNANIIRAEFGSLTPENSMKWDATEGSRGSFNLGGGDTVVNFAQSNQKRVRGHTLVWHSQLPGWVSNVRDGSTLTSVIQTHATTLVNRWKGKIYAWDVVNEMFNEDGSYRSSVFYQVLGIEFVRVAFRAARSADPNARLFINDYNLDSANSKARGVVNLVNQLNSESGSRLIDGIGTQMHLGSGGAGGALAALQLLASANVNHVEITELDIQGASSNDYTTVVRACLQVSKCDAIISWGVSDKDSWRASSNPLLFDGSYNKKAAYNAIIQALA